MSTIAKLDPEVRIQRTERATARRFFASQAHLSSDTGRMCITIADILNKLKRDPRKTGAQKQRIAERVEREFEAVMKAIEEKRNALRVGQPGPEGTAARTLQKL